MEARRTTQAATQVGLITLPIGLALVSAPSRIGRLLGDGDYDRAMRVIGTLDLALVPGLLAAPRRRPWLMARAGLNLLIAGYCLRLVQRGDGGVGAKVAAAAMAGATVSDSRALTPH